MSILRRDFLKGVATVPFLGLFAAGVKGNIDKEVARNTIDYYRRLQIDKLDAPFEKLTPPTGITGKRLRIGLIGNGWRGQALLQKFGYVHSDVLEQHTRSGQPSKWLQDLMNQEDLNVEITGICDVFDVHTQRGVDISQQRLSRQHMRPSRGGFRVLSRHGEERQDRCHHDSYTRSHAR